MSNAVERAAEAHELRGKKVYILHILYRSHNIWSRPRSLPFADVSDLFRHLGELISYQLTSIDERHKRRIVTALEMEDFPRAVHFYRRAQMENREAVSLDFYWDSRPTLIM